ncbi:MAG: hypothetical protein ABIP79_00840 [Chitinophagaceae bacterium]
MEQNQEPGLIKFFTKILNSIAWFLLWTISCATAGIYFQLGYITGKPLIQPILFYTGMIVSLLFLIRYLYKAWKK